MVNGKILGHMCVILGAFWMVQSLSPNLKDNLTIAIRITDLVGEL
jgi:hypothetical protein